MKYYAFSKKGIGSEPAIRILFCTVSSNTMIKSSCGYGDVRKTSQRLLAQKSKMDYERRLSYTSMPRVLYLVWKFDIDDAQFEKTKKHLK
jgi:hypothetical protein